MSEKIIHLDSRNSIYNTIFSSSTKTTKNCFNTNFKLNERFSNIKKITIKSLEIPIGFTNIRLGSTSMFSFNINSLKFNIDINPGNYTSIESLIIEINNKIIMWLNIPYVVTLVLVPATNRLRLNISGTRPITFSIVNTHLSMYILGFRSENDKLVDTGTETITIMNVVAGVISTVTVTSLPTATSPYYYLASTSTYNLNPDNYISMYIPQLGYVSDMNGINTTYKIPMNCVYGMTYFFQQSQNFDQSIEIKNKAIILNEMDIIFYDRFGRNIDNNGLDYSLSLLIEYDN